MTEEPTLRLDSGEWQDRFAEALAETMRKREARSELRSQLSRRRAFGLKARHAAKLARLASPEEA